MLDRSARAECLCRLNIETLSPMQEAAFAAGERGGDVILLSPTGSGKTVAYLWPLAFQMNEADEAVQGIVLQPSRELAEQSEGLFRRMKSGVRSLCLCGGHSVGDELNGLRSHRPQVVFATPGRLRDHLERGNLTLDQVTFWVMDEFDKCMELGFETDLLHLIRRLPASARKWLLSATASEVMAPFIAVEQATVLDFTAQAPAAAHDVDSFCVNYTSDGERDALLCGLLNRLGGQSSIVFLATRDAAARLYARLRAGGFPVEIYHGGMMQSHREKALFRFRSGCSCVLVATDLAARGLDIPDVRNVIHYEQPDDARAFIHRCGRATRWGHRGASYLFLPVGSQLPPYVADARPVVGLTGAEQRWKALPLPWAPVYIGRGKKEKLSKGDVVGFFCRKGFLAPGDIGQIEIAPHCTYVAIARAKAETVLQAVQGEKIKGMRTIVALMR